MNTIAVVQARMGSTRLPNKVMRPICGTPMIGLLLERLSHAKHIDQIVLATSEQPNNQALVTYVRDLGYAVYQGSENDVLDRTYQAVKQTGADTVVRITGDCPLIDPELTDAVVDLYKQGNTDYVSNTDPPTFPDGLSAEVFSFRALETAWHEATESFHREHVTPFIRESAIFKTTNYKHANDESDKRWTVDEPEDFEVVQKVFEHFHPRRNFGWLEVLALQREHPEWFKSNQHLTRNYGGSIGTGQKLWKRAKRVIPGDNMLFSKRAEMFLPEQWPAYFSRAQGCRVWDLDGRAYTDMSIMGIGTNILGYGHPEVDSAVRNTIDNGNMSTFNCPEEVYLAERLVELHSWADMVRFARTGGEANTIAIRIARAATGKDKVAFCGYHGWHDWYLAANLSDEKNLERHLLPGLAPKGVPASLRNTIFPFNYNCFKDLEALVNTHDIGVIKMEVSRNQNPEPGFLKSVRNIAIQKGIVLIFDECTSGFRQTFGGLHKQYGVEPDMALFGKAMGNGYAITAVVGRREVMEAAQTSFISSTFWTERIGPTAGLKTLEVMERLNSWDTITVTGEEIRRRWIKLADAHGLQIDLWGIPALSGFTIKSPHALAYKTLITQEMLTKGFLAGNCVYVSIAHTPEIVDSYFEVFDPIFGLIRECEDGRDVHSLIKGSICHAGFKRLN